MDPYLEAIQRQWGAARTTQFRSSSQSMRMIILKSAVDPLPENVKQAFLAAIHKFGKLSQNTWEGCAFNAASLVEGHNIQGSEEVARFFKCPVHLVGNFIRAWDSHQSGDPTNDLKMILTGEWQHKAHSASPKITTTVVFESTLKDFSDDLDAGKISDEELEKFFPSKVMELLGV